MDWTALRVSLLLAAGTTFILWGIGVPWAYRLVRSPPAVRRRWELLVTLPLVLPPTVLGFYLLLLTAPTGPVGRFTHATFGTTLPFTFPGLLLASTIANLPFAMRPFLAALRGVDPHLEEAAWCLGVSRRRTFFAVVLPAAAPGLLAGGVLTFAHTLGEFGVILMMGGNIPGATRTLSVALYDHVQALDYAAAHRTAALLTALALGLLLLLQRLTDPEDRP